MKSIALIFMKSKDNLFLGAGLARPRLPYPLLHLGSYLINNGVNVFLIDGQVCDAKEELLKIIDEVDIVGFSVMTMQVQNSLELSDFIRKEYPNKRIIWGGIHPSLLPEQTILDDSIDYVCQREGEGCLLELCQEKPVSEIKNLVYKEKGIPVMNEIREFIDINKEDKPIWEILDLENYIKAHTTGPKKGERSIDLAIGRGCCFSCSYCCNKVLGQKWRALCANEIVKRIKFLKKQHNIQHFTIGDDCFDVDMGRVEEFCKQLIEENIKITWDTSVRVGKKWTDERMQMLYDSGCIGLSVGAESGSDRILNSVYHKGITIQDTIFMAEQCNKHRIQLGTTWICGIPNENEEEMQQTRDLLKKVVKICPNCTVSGPQIFRPYPNCELYFEAVKLGYKEPQSLREWANKSAEQFISEEELPWLKNPKKLKAIEFYYINAFRYSTSWAHKILINLSKFRINHDFYSFRFEIPITKFYMNKIHKEK